ncbi:hypothetical protein CPAR01_05179 [Colletotrichum paranaense]|uniref:Methyltransferase domain-containing protein n=1 Tax=Colletotrichum paranaense TaxID=1914294 RepID=A0ABQ9SRT1_9PEZI|nr:uncharacterized protein CPAR01_05179 [Colletotrichum paranaense]KAK1541792.1 hypothetical protein CPAR01_05179 [Colletotrichum paranaense]
MCNNQSGPPVNHGPVIVVDEITDDNASERLTSLASSTHSLSSSILQHRHENGRTYHKYKAGRYNYPNDEREMDRLDFQHELFLLTLNDRLGLAPPNEPGSKVNRVLDLGTGTGIWAIDFADEHPEAVVYGVDLSPTQTTAVPPNIRFEVDDIEETWTYREPFDYIHCRAMTSSISDWRKLLQQTYDHLEPGGWFELQEGHVRPLSDDGTLTREHSLSRWADYIEEACNIMGRPFVNVLSLVEVMREIGYVNVTYSTFKWPLNTWPKDEHYQTLGHFNHENYMEGIEGFTLAPFTRALKWSREAIDMFLVGVRNDLRNRYIHAYIPIQLIHARKPERLNKD